MPSRFTMIVRTFVAAISWGLAAVVVVSTPRAALADDKPDAPPSPDAANTPQVSFARQIQPIFRAHCQGCHQPAKRGGDFVMTSFELLKKGGESGDAAVVPGQPDRSRLVAAITPVDGQAEMPKDKPALTPAEIDLIRRWIAQGAADDSPAQAARRYDADHPPTYSRPPVITSLDFSPDGRLVAVAGFHEVLLIAVDDSRLAGRLVGMSERIESVRFSPDGRRLAATGGLPGRMGEVQIWDVEQRKLLLSHAVTADTLYGGSWSPDGQLVAFGCADNSVRAIRADSGEQVLFQGAHNDWVRDTVFSNDGSHLLSVGRDMTVKLTEVATQRFVDNVTSITPGALKGGVQAIARHPRRDEVVIGGADGVAKVYRMQRLTKRVIGDDANLIRELPPLTGRIFGVAVSRDGRRIAAGSSLDGAGHVAVYGYEFDTSLPNDIKAINEKVVTQRSDAEKKKLAAYHAAGVQRICEIASPTSAVYAVAFRGDEQVAAAGSDGIVRLYDATSGALVSQWSPAAMAGGPTSPATPASETGAADPAVAASDTTVDFIRDVNPILSRLGCNQGTCHGAAKGKNGFKLSLRGYDASFDVRALTDDLASRRVNLASPDDSLMLLKATSTVPHQGGQLMKPDDPYYRVVRQWIASGAKLNLATPRVVKIDVTPKNPLLSSPGDRQPMQVVATYADGVTRNVTREAFIDSGDMEVALADREGVLTAVRRGESPVLARYEGAYAATTLTVMGDRSGFVWSQPTLWNEVDRWTAAKWERLKIEPSGLCTDAEFLRRVHLDLTGLPPSAEEVKAFLADQRDTRVKRDEVIDRLIGSEAFVEYWTNKWADLLQVNRKFLGPEGASRFRQWIRGEVAANTRYDEFVHKILTASGSNRDQPAASYFKILRTPQDTMENTTQLFLGVRFNCNKCHDHPFERWTQDQYYQTAAYFAQFQLARDPRAGNGNIGGTAVEGAKPLYEVVSDAQQGEVVHERTGQPAAPQFPFDCQFDAGESEPTRRETLAAWITSPANPYFARSYVNRLWGYLFGVGIMEPIDDLRAGNPPTNPELLDYLTREFMSHDFDMRHMLRTICQSRTYQLSVATNRWNADDKLNYSHSIARRLPAEVLLDSIYAVTGSQSRIPGVPPGTRAAALPDSGVELPSGFLATFGRPTRESACECERTAGMQLGPVMALISGPTVADAIADGKGALPKLVAAQADDRALVNEVFLRVVGRPAADAEIAAVIEEMASLDEAHARLVAQRTERQRQVDAELPRLEKQRAETLDAAKSELAAYQASTADAVARLQRERDERIARAEQALRDAEASSAERQAAWEKEQVAKLSQAEMVGWTVFAPHDASATGDAVLKVAAEGDVAVGGKNEKSIFTLLAKTELREIRAIRLEMLTADGLPNRGPGRNRDGNFVLNELELAAAPADKPTEFLPVELKNPQADYVQDNFQAAQLIDGAKAQRNGWAVAGATGVVHWVTFELSEPLRLEPGAVLRFQMYHQFNQPGFQPGRFRFSATDAQKPVGLSLADELYAALAASAEQRSDSQKDFLAKYFQATVDKSLRELRKRLAEARQPVPVDPQLQRLEARVAAASQPLPPDARLEEWKRDEATSARQLENRRLTAVQDLVWVLINTPEFLFNH